MPKARKVGPTSDGTISVVFFCVSCGNNHVVPYVNVRPHPKDRAVWFFDENFEQPTIEPSLRVFNQDGKTTACHVVVTSGFLNYQGDHPGEFKGKRVPMVDCKLIDEQ